jgi:hypothetical protein
MVAFLQWCSALCHVSAKITLLHECRATEGGVPFELQRSLEKSAAIITMPLPAFKFVIHQIHLDKAALPLSRTLIINLRYWNKEGLPAMTTLQAFVLHTRCKITHRKVLNVFKYLHPDSA